MFIGILRTHYEVFAVGETEKEVKARIVRGYKALYPKDDRKFEKPTFDDLNEYFGCNIFEIDSKKGYAHE